MYTEGAPENALSFKDSSPTVPNILYTYIYTHTYKSCSWKKKNAGRVMYFQKRSNGQGGKWSDSSH
jgi:hypothetical protein